MLSLHQWRVGGPVGMSYRTGPRHPITLEFNVSGTPQQWLLSGKYSDL